MKQSKPAATQPGSSAGRPAGGRVAMTIHVSGEIFAILGDTALAREFGNVARASQGQKVKQEDRNQSIAAVIEELIESNRDELGAECKGVRPGQARRKVLARAAPQGGGERHEAKGERRGAISGSDLLKEKHFAANSTISDEGKMGDVAYVIRSGRVEIRKGSPSSILVRLAELGKGDVLGEMALFDDSPRMASAIALTDVKLIQMSKKEFLERLSTIDPAIKRMVLTMVTRVRNMADEFMQRKEDENREY